MSFNVLDNALIQGITVGFNNIRVKVFINQSANGDNKIAYRKKNFGVSSKAVGVNLIYKSKALSLDGIKFNICKLMDEKGVSSGFVWKIIVIFRNVRKGANEILSNPEYETSVGYLSI